jgi:hypothetical protein
MTHAADIEHLAPLAQGLDLSNAEDRAIFRVKVAEALVATRVSAVCEWVGIKHASRVNAVRAAADAFIKCRA